MPHTIFNNNVLKLRPGEATNAWLMFAYSFLAMTSYNIVKPLTKGKFIDQMGADNTPYIQLAAVVVIGVLMQLYSQASGHLRGRAIAPVTLTGLAGLLVTFWLLFQTDAVWVSATFYVFGFMFGILTISQFWTIANDIYDSRQARRLFGFIGGGASLGGALGNGITGFFQQQIGQNNLLLVSAAVLGLCIVIVTAILRGQTVTADLAHAGDERGVGGSEALRLLRSSRHLQIIALVIGFASLSATIVDWQVNKTAESSGSVSEFLGQVGFYLSLTSFVIQVALTSVIHRSLGLAVALLVLPLGLGTAAMMIIATGFFWLPAAASVMDRSLRYSLDKTTREVLFLPLSSDLKQRAKPFVDVTVDRLGKALGAVFVLVLIKPWGLGLTWQQVSWASLSVIAIWVVTAFVARREYLRSFRRSLGNREIEPGAVRVNVADAATIEALVEELAHPDEASVLYAIDMLEMLDRRHLITPLLIHHESARVRARALRALSSVRADLARTWIPAVHRMLKDPDADVRAAAVRALEALAGEEAPALMHRFLEDADPRVAATAATVLADSSNPADPPVALAALTTLCGDDRVLAAGARREAASALGHISHPDFRALLVPLLNDRDLGVASEAIASARAIGADARFLPALVSLLGHRVLKAPARATLVSYGESVVPALAYFLHDQGEHLWVRRHVPATLAAIPCQPAMDALITALADADGFLRYKVIEAISALRRSHPALTLPPGVIEALVVAESARYYNYLTLRFNIVSRDSQFEASLLIAALDDKLDRTTDRVLRLLGLIYPWQDMAAARQALEGTDMRMRVRAVEYLDNLLAGPIRRRVMPMLEDAPAEEKANLANKLLGTRPRDLEDTLAQLMHESDSVVAAACIAFVQTHQLWSLADDLEYVVARRSADHLATDAASWALASRRRSAGAHNDVTHPLPIVEIADRLRAIPLFGFVSVDELFRIAATGRQMRYAPGHVIYEQGTAADTVQFLTAGAVQLTGGGRVAEVRAPATLAFEDMLEGRPVGHTIVATEAVVTLAVSGATLLTMMSDNIVLARGFFRMLIATDGHRPPRDAVQAAGTETLVNGWRLPLEPFEKAGLLRQSPILSRASVEQLLDLVAITREVPLVEGEVLSTERDLSTVHYVLDGEVVLEQAGEESVVVTAGGLIGMAETLAGLPLTCRARVVQAGHALRFEQDPLFGVLADHVDLLQGLFSGVLKARNDATSKRPARDGPDRSP